MEAKRQVWTDRVASWRRSGQTAREFAEASGVKEGTLRHWAWQLSYEKRQAAKPQSVGKGRGKRREPTALIEVVSREVERGEGFDLRLAGGRQLHIPAGFEAAALSRLLAVLEDER